MAGRAGNADTGQIAGATTSPQTPAIEEVVAAISEDDVARDTGQIVRVPSLTGSERDCLEVLAEIAVRHGLAAELEEYDLERLRTMPGYPGSTAARESLYGLKIVLGSEHGRRFCFNGHIDVVSPGATKWTRDPWSGMVEDGYINGRGTADMKGAVVAALHALAAIRRVAGEPEYGLVLQVVSSEEDGGQGTFAALDKDDRFDACLIPEPTGFRVVRAQAGSLGFKGFVNGRAAHAAVRREGISAIDRYVRIHQAMADLERERNSDIAHPLMAALELPYPISVGRLEAGDWFAQVPDWLRFEGRLGVKMGEKLDSAREALEVCARTAVDDPAAVDINWSGAEFAPGETDENEPLIGLVLAAAAKELGRVPSLGGVPYGADMRLYCERGIPCVMYGTNGLELAHAANERVAASELATLSRTLARVALGFAHTESLKQHSGGGQGAAAA